jgi:hypothetical protein
MYSETSIVVDEISEGSRVRANVCLKFFFLGEIMVLV